MSVETGRDKQRRTDTSRHAWRASPIGTSDTCTVHCVIIPRDIQHVMRGDVCWAMELLESRTAEARAGARHGIIPSLAPCVDRVHPFMVVLYLQCRFSCPLTESLIQSPR